MAEAFDWLKPSPLWSGVGSGVGKDYRNADFFRPLLLQFASDDFMDEFLAAAGASSPSALAAAAIGSLTDGPVKLYQPAHGCFYLTCASLCCRLAGFPDRELRTGDGESAFFVLRRLDAAGEYAWVPGPEDKGWHQVATARSVYPGEERLPLFAARTGGERSVQFGYLPVASRETYQVPAEELTAGTPPDGLPSGTDFRVEALEARFTAQLPGVATARADQRLTVSVYLLVELWEFLRDNSKDVADALQTGTSSPTFAGERALEKTALVTFLQRQRLGGSVTLAAALKLVADVYDSLNQPGGGDLGALGFGAGAGSDYNLAGRTLDGPGLLAAVKPALSDEQPPVELPKLRQQTGDRYIVRCVYERPQCEPVQQLVSQPSAEFELAAFFDPDAPARQVRIPLPTDVSIAGLRRAKKNVAFLMSDAMRKKMASISGKEKDMLSSAPALSEPGGDLAFVCSFSIQIIFIVAFFLLLIFVVILNIVFWWIAFFKICLPLPKRLLPG